MDALDGAVARAMGRTDRRGAVLDSTLDRFADGFIYSGLAYYFAALDDLNYMLLALAALISGFVVSYVRARAGEAGLAVRVGLLDRMVRILILLAALLLPPLLLPALWVLAVGSAVTVFQRLWYVYKHLDRGN
jgi:CDP-diacylglycerol---glycerol-3-phosphate 3-phosphatidyltransferase